MLDALYGLLAFSSTPVHSRGSIETRSSRNKLHFKLVEKLLDRKGKRQKKQSQNHVKHSHAQTNYIQPPKIHLKDVLFGFNITTVIVITVHVYSLRILRRKTAKGPFGLRRKLPPLVHCPSVSNTEGVSHCPFVAEHQAGKP